MCGRARLDNDYSEIKIRNNRGQSVPGDGYERNPTSPSKTLRAKIGGSFRPTTGRDKRTEELRFERHASNTNGSPRRAAKAKERPAGVNRRVG